MSVTRRDFLFLLSTAAASSLAACSAGGTSSSGTGTSSASSSTVDKSEFASLALDMSKWNHDDTNDIWWQIGLQYCTKPATTTYESLGLYVPGAYLTGKDNGDGTYTCTVDKSAKVGDYTASSAPFVLPLNTGGYAAQAAPTSYSSSGLTDYLSAGLIYVFAGCRGKNSNGTDDFPAGAPWGVTDLKAAIRYLRYNASSLPGDTTRVFTFGHSGGGAQSALVGATGDASIYEQYLTTIGAATHDAAGNTLSDATMGTMCWCPITSLEAGNEAYEWMMGQFASTDTRADGTFTKLLSDDLSKAFASHVNEMDFRDENGSTLSLTEGGDGIYLKGSYYDYLKSVIEKSLNNFLSDNTFPYTPSTQTMTDLGAGGGGSTGGAGGMGGRAGGSAPSGSAPSGSAPTGDLPATDSSSSSAMTGRAGGMAAMGATTDTTTYATVDDYISSLNSDESWVTYDAASNTATITSIGAFVRKCKTPSKSVGAFDSLDRTQAENYVFGTGSSPAMHFDPTISNLLAKNKDTYSAASNWDSSYPSAYTDDLAKTDSLGVSVADRLASYSPMYFLSGHYAGFGKSEVAPHWRIRTGINQGDTSLTTETDLALALNHYDGVKDVDFATVWGLGHTPAERTGTAVTNFISWVKDCCA